MVDAVARGFDRQSFRHHQELKVRLEPSHVVHVLSLMTSDEEDLPLLESWLQWFWRWTLFLQFDAQVSKKRAEMKTLAILYLMEG